ncbi:amidohydrolase [Mammaliicoccus stepanovicii]|uniref:Metal-dependent amidase n=1 Tax=Mammaliicoccus stepanovicii TaxID=643214 RepID=A0A239YJ37_9STAP|nr:amidohydrolase [Mammaliicoccus stepanovicii]PNZ74693.1 amidohydrolase [Mammaliicoccus stepanovicii]GGI40839.1 amidohydrolase [Mammaliicoccus stepanovicii]SNV58204.1 metal-dependent amidase [Mammaliicoccus stepanovicii]
MINRFYEALSNKENKMIEIRRYLHAHPELSFEEEKTAQYISDFYKDKDVEIKTHIGGKGIYGIKVTIDSGKPGKTLALRADFDALPIKEDTGLAFTSKNEGVMHACGHDAHTAYLMVLAETLIEFKDHLQGKIIIIHQPAEEKPPGGAQALIKDGILDGVDNVIGVHVISNLESNRVYYREGNVQSGRNIFKLKIIGQGGHGSSPHLANDPIVAASSFVMSVQTIVSRKLNPFDMGVISIGSFDGKGQFNIIKNEVELEGDVRGMNEETMQLIEDEIKRISHGLETMYGVKCDLEYHRDYPVLYNDPTLTKQVANAIRTSNIKEINSVERTEPLPPSEDFAYYAKELPCTFFYVGASPKDKQTYPHHHPKFDIDESSLLIAAKSVAAATFDYLGVKS